MKTVISILLIVLVGSATSNSQTISLGWSRSLDGYGDQDVIVDAATDASGNVYITGWSKSGSNYAWEIMKYNSSGTRQWLREYHPGTTDQPTSIVLHDTCVYVTGRIKPSTYTQLAALELKQSDGTDVHSAFTYSNASYDVEGVVVKVGQSGDIYVGGNAYHPAGSGAANFLIVKFTNGGSTTTNDNDYVGANTPDTLRDMVLGPGDTVFVTGTEKSSSNNNYLTRKLDPSLSDKWMPGGNRGVTYDYTTYANSYDAAVRILLLSSGSSIVTGHSQSAASTYDIATVKYDGSGTQQGSAARYSYGAYYEIIGDVGIDSAQTRIYICGSPDGNHELLLAYNTSLAQQFATTIGGGSPSNILIGKRLKVDRSGNVWTAIDNDDLGNHYTYGYDVALTVFNSSGTYVTALGFDATYGTTKNGTGPNDFCYAMADDGNSGNIYLAGSMNPSFGSSSPQDFFLVKFTTNSTFSSATSLGRVGGPPTGQPVGYGISQNYPNPFNPSTIIRYTMPEAGKVSLKIYDILGREVKVLINNQSVEKGIHEVNFDASGLSSGAYYYRIISGDGKFEAVKKMLFVK